MISLFFFENCRKTWSQKTFRIKKKLVEINELSVDTRVSVSQVGGQVTQRLIEHYFAKFGITSEDTY